MTTLAFNVHQQMRRDFERNVVISDIPEEEDEDDIPTEAMDVLKRVGCSYAGMQFSSHMLEEFKTTGHEPTAIEAILSFFCIKRRRQ